MMPLNIKLFSTSGVSKTITKTIKDSYNNSYTVTISINETLGDDYITTNKSLLSGSVVVSNTGNGGAYTSSKSMSATLTFKHTNSSGDTLLTKTGSCKFDFQGNATKTATPLSFSGSEISHDSDGSLTLYIAIQLKITETSLKQTQNWTDSITLTSIPRASTLNSFTSTNTTATYGYTKKNSGFYDVVIFTSNGKTLGTINNPQSSAGTYSGLTKSYDMSKVLKASTSAGSKTITVTCTIQTYSDSSKTTLIGSSSSSTSISLGTSTLSSVTLSIANNGTATIVPTISKWNAGTYDVLTISGNNFSQIFNNVSSGTTYTLNNTNLFNAMGTSTSLTLNCVLTTYSAQNGTSLGTSAQNNKTISLPAYSINALVNSYSDLNNSSQPGSMGYALSTFKPNTQTMIRYLSSPKITFKVSSSTGYLYGRNISTSGAATKTGLSHNSTFDVTIGTNPNSSYSITATDGRKSGSVTQSFTVVPYFIPSVTCSIVRPLPTSTTADVTIKATYYNDSGSLLTNKKTINNSNGSLTLQYTEEGGSQVTKTYSNFTISNSTSGTSTTMTATLQLTGLDPSKSITYSVVFKDLITYQAKSNGTIPNGQPALSVYRKSGKNYVKANGDLIVRGNTIVDSIKGKNMFDAYGIEYIARTGTTYTINNSNKITATSNNVNWSRQEIKIRGLTSGKKYTLSSQISNSSNTKAGLLIDNQGVSVYNIGTENNIFRKITFTAPSDYIQIQLYTNWSGTSASTTVTFDNLQLEEGSTATSYVPYQNLDSNEIYSTGESIVGTWIDGKPIYRKVVQVTLTATNTWTYFANNFNNLSEVVTIKGFYTPNNYSYNRRSVTESGNDIVVQTTNNGKLACQTTNSSAINVTWTITVEYTKTTD